MVIVRHDLIETKRIEKLLLVSVVPPHHRPPLPSITSAPVKSRVAAHFNGLLQQNRPNSETKCASQDFSGGESIVTCRH
jgi:hypothetical protein